MKNNFKMSEKFLYRPQCIRQNKEHCNMSNVNGFTASITKQELCSCR